MFNFSPRRSTVVVNLMIAIVITLIVNFSYLIAMMVDERNNKEQQQREQITYGQTAGGKEQGGRHMRHRPDGKDIEPMMREQTMRHKPECSGVLHLSRDGYGYLISETNFSPEYPDSVHIHLDGLTSGRGNYSIRSLNRTTNQRCGVERRFLVEVNRASICCKISKRTSIPEYTSFRCS